MKIKMLIAAGTLALATATSAASIERPNLQRSYVVTLEAAMARDLDDCQLKEYGRCMQKFNDHEMCVMAAQTHDCPPGW